MSKKSPEAEKVAAPARSLKIKRSGVDHEIVMTFGLLNELASAVGSLDEAQTLLTDNDKSNMVISLALAERDERGRVVGELPNVEEGDLVDLEEYEVLFNWLLEHILGFFMKRMKAFANASARLGPELRALNKLATGSQA